MGIIHGRLLCTLLDTAMGIALQHPALAWAGFSTIEIKVKFAIGCHNINWVTPEHVVPQILEALPLGVDGGLLLPLVYNTSAYDSPDSLALMDGVVDIYMPDLKLSSSELSRRYVGKREYFEVASRSAVEMRRQVGELVMDEQGLARRGLIVRHLVMPGAVAETEAVLRFVVEELGPDTSAYEEVREHAEEIFSRLADGTMPCAS